MPIRFLNRARGSGSTRAFDTDVLAWRDAVVANGGSVSLARLIIVDQFVFSEKAATTWALTDDYWAFWAENTIQALTSLKQRRLATAVNSPTFTADRDYTFNGTTSYIDTGFIPSTHGINCNGTDQRLGAYERTNVSTNSTVTAGTFDTGSRLLQIVNRRVADGGMSARLNSTASAMFATSPLDSRGLKTASRAGGGTTGLAYDRGVRLTDVTGLAVANMAPSRSIYAGAFNNAGTAASFRAAALGFLVVGAPVSDAQELAHYNAVQAWATSVGAQV